MSAFGSRLLSQRIEPRRSTAVRPCLFCSLRIRATLRVKPNHKYGGTNRCCKGILQRTLFDRFSFAPLAASRNANVGASSVSMADDPVRDATLKPGSLGNGQLVICLMRAKHMINNLTLWIEHCILELLGCRLRDTNVFVLARYLHHQTPLSCGMRAHGGIVKSPNTSSTITNVSTE